MTGKDKAIHVLERKLGKKMEFDAWNSYMTDELNVLRKI